jgi:hypothetical protein
MVGLNYNIDVNDRVARTKPGMVLLPDMKQIHPVGLGVASQDSIGAQQYSANRSVFAVVLFLLSSLIRADCGAQFWERSTGLQVRLEQ